MHLSPDGRWKWDGRAWVYSREHIESGAGVSAAAGGLGCAAFAVLYVVILVGVLGMGDYPSEPDAVIALASVAVLSAVTLIGTGWLIGYLNRRWWIRGSLIATWPAIVSSFLGAVDWLAAGTYRNFDLAATATGVVGSVIGMGLVVGLLLAGGLLARRQGRPKRQPSIDLTAADVRA